MESVAAGSALHPPQNHTQEKKNYRDSWGHPSLKRKQNYKNFLEIHGGRDLSKRKQNFKRILEIHGGQMMVHQRAPPCTRRKIHKSTVKHETFMYHMPPQNTHISRDF